MRIDIPCRLSRCRRSGLTDPVVIQEIERLDAIPDTREQWLQKVMEEATNKHADEKARISALCVYGEAMGWLMKTIPKEQGNPGEWTQKQIDMYRATQTPVDT